jgi:hypothetical protein
MADSCSIATSRNYTTNGDVIFWGVKGGGIRLDGCLGFEPSVTLLWFQTPDIYPTKVLQPPPLEHIAICSIIPWYGHIKAFKPRLEIC